LCRAGGASRAPPPPVWDAECVASYLRAGGRTVVYVGEREERVAVQEGSPPDCGASASRAFQALLSERFELLRAVRLHTWSYNSDDLTVWRRREEPPVVRTLATIAAAPEEEEPTGGDAHAPPASAALHTPPATAHLLGGIAWNGARVLAAHIATRGGWAQRLSGGAETQVCELGAGTGVAGLQAAALAGPNAYVTLSDKHASLVDDLAASIRERGLGDRCCAKLYEWAVGDAAALLPAHSSATHFDLILGAECLYSLGTAGAFAAALDALAGPTTVVLISCEHRWSTAECLATLEDLGWCHEVLSEETTPPMPGDLRPARVSVMELRRRAPPDRKLPPI